MIGLIRAGVSGVATMRNPVMGELTLRGNTLSPVAQHRRTWAFAIALMAFVGGVVTATVGYVTYQRQVLKRSTWLTSIFTYGYKSTSIQ